MYGRQNSSITTICNRVDASTSTKAVSTTVDTQEQQLPQDGERVWFMNDYLLKFFGRIEKRPIGMRGFMVMDDLQDSQESVVLTFWKRKEDMDSFYKPDNKILNDLVEKLKPSFEHSPMRKDYQVAKFKVW